MKILLWLLAAVLVAAILFQARPAFPAPKAESPAECQVLADIAVTARALAVAGVPEHQAHVAAAHLWDTRTERVRELVRLIIFTAYRSRDEVSDYGYRVGLTCMRDGGDMDSVLGQDI